MVQRMMQGEVVSIWCLVLLLTGPQLGDCSAVSLSVVIDGYTHNRTLISGDSVPLGTQLILICWVAGIPYGTPLSYTWTCPIKFNEEGEYGQNIYDEHLLVVNTTSPSGSGKYTCTCQVTAMYAGGQEVNGSLKFTFRVAGGRLVHSYGRLIPHEFPITSLQQIAGPDGTGRITCMDSSGLAKFMSNGGRLKTDGVTHNPGGAIATLLVNPNATQNFRNKGVYCTELTNFFYLFISEARSHSQLKVQRLTNHTVTASIITFEVGKGVEASETDPFIAGYEVFRFGVPMIGEYVNAHRGSNVTISSAVPGTKYRITAWTLDSTNHWKSATSAVMYATTRVKKPSRPRHLVSTREFEDGIELNWLPPIEPNGEVHYVIYYTLENGTELSIFTGSDLTHYNMTGLERNTVYTNIAVQAVNSAGRSRRRAVIAQYNHTPPIVEAGHSSHQPGDAATIAGSVTSFLVVVLLLTLTGGVVVVVIVRARRKKRSEAKCPTDNDSKYYNTRPNEDAYCYVATADKNTINPASATASISAHTNEDEPCDVSTEQKSPITAKPEELYTLPKKMKKENERKNSQEGKYEQIAASAAEMYAKLDMTKNEGQGSQQHLQEDTEEVKQAPTAPLPYKKYKEAQEKGDEDEESGAGSLLQEKRYDYVMLDWDNK